MGVWEEKGGQKEGRVVPYKFHKVPYKVHTRPCSGGVKVVWRLIRKGKGSEWEGKGGKGKATLWKECRFRSADRETRTPTFFLGFFDFLLY